MLNLLNHYIFVVLIKLINIFIFKVKFLLLIFEKNFYNINNIIYINSSNMKLYSMYKYYLYKSLYFLQLFLYKYYKVILVIKYKQKQERDYKFDNTYIQKKIF